jgi:hypothetical protein
MRSLDFVAPQRRAALCRIIWQMRTAVREGDWMGTTIPRHF